MNFTKSYPPPVVRFCEYSFICVDNRVVHFNVMILEALNDNENKLIPYCVFGHKNEGVSLYVL